METGGINDEPERPLPVYTSEEAKAISDQFDELIRTAKEARELVFFLDEHMKRLDSTTADGLFTELEAYYRTDLGTLNEAFLDREVEVAFAEIGYRPQPMEVVEEIITNEKALQLIQIVKEGKYKLETSEGIYYSIIDYSALKEAYGSYLSAELQEYLALMAFESDQPSTADAAIIVPWSEFAKRALAAEGYLKQYPNGQRTEKVVGLYRGYLSRYFFGSSNTDITGDRGVVKQEVMSSYRETIANAGDTLTGRLTKDYVDIIDDFGGKISWEDAEVEKRLNQFYRMFEDLQYEQITAIAN